MGLFNSDDDDEDTTAAATAKATADDTDATDGTQPAPDTSKLVANYVMQKYGIAPAAAATATPVPAASNTPQAPQSLGDKYKALAGDTSKIDAARDEAANQRTNAGIFQGLSTIFAGPGYTDANFYNGVRSHADAQLAQAQAQRQDMLKNYLTGNSLDRQSVLDKYAATNQAQKEKQAGFADVAQQTAQDQQKRELDPNSDESKLAQALAAKQFPDLDASKLTAAQYKAQGKGFSDIFDANMKKQEMEMQQARLTAMMGLRTGQKDEDRDLSFGKAYNADKGKFVDAASKIDNTLDMVDQATNKGGVTAKLVPLEVARGIAGRLNPQEIAAAGGDPSLLGKLNRMISTAAEGQMDGVDAGQFRALLQAQKDHLNTAWNTKSDARINTYANATGHNIDNVRHMVGAVAPTPAASAINSPSSTSPAAAPATAPAPSSYPKVMTDGKNKVTVTSANEEKEASGEGYK